MTTTENQIEQDLISRLQDLKYTHRPDIRDRAALESNFRQHFEALNRVHLTDSEFARLLDSILTPDVFGAARHLRERNHFERDDGTPLHYTLVNIRDWCKNTFEVINQLRISTDYSHHRYDVILLINGVPVVQIELKTLTISPRRAMQQIVDYRNDPGNGYSKTLLCFMQLFIVSNRSDTWYFANNNSRHFSFNADERFLPLYQFASGDNTKITHLDSFAEAFLAKCTLGEMISRYMVLVASEQKLLMMRPYQIYAVKAIVECIHQKKGNGYIWHTTGSGKTLTSFKASTLLKDNPDIDKCLFVVDRKDLDRQTREEFNKFQEGCVEENTNTETLVRRLLSDDYADKVIVTTIQKLGLALDGSHRRNYKERLEPLRNQRMVFIFDECHRSQFGENHRAIKEFFPNAQLFGFTGTPIFDQNSSAQQIEGQQASYKTTADIFQQQLHAYTITHAIEDRNVLRFHVDYYKPDGNSSPKSCEPLAKRAIVEAILAKHDAATNQRKFNAVLATAGINDAIEYHALFKTVQAERQATDPDFQALNIACVFSPPAEGNQDVQQIQEDLPQEKADNEQNPDQKKAALQSIIADYNTRYGSNHSISEFDLYYQDVQKRIKDQQYPNSDLPHQQKIDITIVVDMLLTGFDSKYLNTLYVDKNLKYHGLIQAFSRTNRVLNDTKPYGNILDFRQQQDAVDTAIGLFSGESTQPAKEIWLVDKAPLVIERLQAAMRQLDDFMQSQGLENKPEAVSNLRGDAARARFINLFKEVQRLNTQLDQYTDLTPEDRISIEQVLPRDQLQGFKGVYLDTARRMTEQQDTGVDRTDPVVQELDFEFVLFASAVIDYDYIMALLARYASQSPDKQKMSREQLIGLIQSDAKFIDERDEIVEYIDTLEAGRGLNEAAIRAGFERFKADKHVPAAGDIAGKHGLDAAALQTFVDTTLRRMVFDGEQLSDLMAPLGLGWKARIQAELALMKELIPLLKKLAHGREISGLGRMSNEQDDITMKTAETRPLVPKLRFPKFREAKEWSIKSMGEVYLYKGNNSLSRDKLNYESGSIRNIHYGDIHTKFSTLFDITKEVVPYVNASEPREFFKEENFCIEGDIIFADASEDLDDIGKSIEIITLNGERVVSGLHTILARQSAEWFVIGFGGYLFKSYAIRKQIQKESQGAKVLGLSSGRLAKIKISFPPDKQEQQKIADCLASLDDLITAQTQKLAALKIHKKGLMQQLFPAEGETVPKLRFPEFREAGEWDLMILGAVCDMRAGKFVAAADISEQNGNNLYPCYGGNGLRGYTKTYTHSGCYLLIGRQGALCGNVNLVDGFFHATEHAVVTTPTTGIHTEWLFYMLDLLNLNRFATGQAQPGLSVEVLNKIACAVPAEELEQQKIADCLASLDEVISLEGQKLAALKTHKKGLMQQLFPVLN